MLAALCHVDQQARTAVSTDASTAHDCIWLRIPQLATEVQRVGAEKQRRRRGGVSWAVLQVRRIMTLRPFKPSLEPSLKIACPTPTNMAALLDLLRLNSIFEIYSIFEIF